jgi:intracellular sulfur oxidation DsrE/DsrF family protein
MNIEFLNLSKTPLKKKTKIKRKKMEDMNHIGIKTYICGNVIMKLSA